MDDAAGTKSLVVTSVKNIMEPSKSSCTVDEALLRPWLDALLGACGLHRTIPSLDHTEALTCCPHRYRGHGRQLVQDLHRVQDAQL